MQLNLHRLGRVPAVVCGVAAYGLVALSPLPAQDAAAPTGSAEFRQVVADMTAAKPNKLKLFAAALAASFALALGGPFAYELLLNRRIRCRDDLERGFRIVTLAEFGPIRPVQAA